MKFFAIALYGISILLTIPGYGRTSNSSSEPSKITLIGVSHIGKRIRLSLNKWEKNFDNEITLCSSVYLNDTDLIVQCKLSNPVEGQILGLGLISSPIYLIPGDSLYFSIDSVSNDPFNRYSLNFFGKYADRYNYFRLLYQQNYNPFQIINKKGYDLKNWAQCKHLIDSVAILRKEFTYSYFKKNADKKFQGYVYNYLNSIHLFDLVALVNKNLQNNIKPPVGLFKEFSPEQFQDKNMMISREYTLAIIYMNDYVLNKPILYRNEFKASVLAKRFRSAVDYFKGIQRSFLIYSLVEQYAKMQIPSYRPKLNEIITYANRHIRDKYFLDDINKWHKYYNFSDILFPDSVLQTSLVDINGKEFTLGNLLNKYEGSAIYIDFWASWCGPCKREIIYNRSIVHQYEEKGMNFIYLSIDKKKNLSKWKSNAKSLQIATHSYAIADSSSALVNYLNVISIPRFIAINTRSQLAYYNAPRPSQKDIFKIVADALLSQKLSLAFDSFPQ